MKLQKILSTILLVIAVDQISARVRPPRQQHKSNHPPVLTRPPPVLGQRQQQQPKQTTTPEAPEVEDEAPATQTQYNNNNFYNDFSPTYAYDPFGPSVFTQSTVGGGASVEEEEMPRRGNRLRNRNMSRNMNRNQRYRIVTTQAPTTPEPDDDVRGHNGAHQGPGSSGMCFCSPLNTCPYGSIARGGACWNILSLFTNIRFQRCCYPPSIARWMFH